MKKIIFLVMMTAAFLAVSCDPSSENPPIEVQVSLMYENAIMDKDGVTVTLMTTDNSASYQAETVAGVATFTVIPGLYNASASFTETDGTNRLLYNGSAAVTVSSAGETAFTINLTVSESSQLVIKELYTGGCQNDAGSGRYMHDSYVILYNNGDTQLDISDVAFAFVSPFNSNTTSKYMVDGVLSYASQGWVPAGYAIWWFTSDVILEPYSQIVVAIDGAIDHTLTYSNSVNLSDGSYYAMYDPEAGFTNASRYPNPSDAIPSSHYLHTFLYGLGNAWPLSDSSPAFIILENADIEAYSQDNTNYDNTEITANVRVLTDWIVDGLEVYRAGNEANNNKRLTPEIDAGYIYYTTDVGYTLYRNVDKEATEALPENEGLLVYNYSGGTVGVDEVYGSTDPSGIDAEASIAAGAHIIYQDTNNSSNDFHQRAVSSLKN